MKFQHIQHDTRLSPFVKSIMTFKSDEGTARTNLPFFADGFPGLMYHKTPDGLYVNPHKKRMPDLFIYGQTIEPIELEIYGNYEIIVFQLYPFLLKSVFGINPVSVTDNCYDLTTSANHQSKNVLGKLSTGAGLTDWVTTISAWLNEMITNRKLDFDPGVLKAIERILHKKGQLNLTETARELNFSKRTFERRFVSETGLLPKQFAKIIQFQSSLTQITVKDFNVLTDVVYENGYADQSHFIRVFKSFTGKTPTQFSRKKIK